MPRVQRSKGREKDKWNRGCVPPLRGSGKAARLWRLWSFARLILGSLAAPLMRIAIRPAPVEKWPRVGAAIIAHDLAMPTQKVLVRCQPVQSYRTARMEPAGADAHF